MITTLFVFFTLLARLDASERGFIDSPLPIGNISSVLRWDQNNKNEISVVIPDLKQIIDVIVNGCMSLEKNLEVLTNDFESEIADEMEKMLLTLKEEIIKIVNGQYEALQLEFTQIFDDATNSIIKCIDRVSKWEYTETDNLLNDKCCELKANIKFLVRHTSNSVRDAVLNSNQMEVESVETVVRAENQKVRSQIEHILSDPHNFCPIIPQIVFPDPAYIASMISSNKPELMEEIKKLIKEFMEQVKLEINRTEELELLGQRNIMDQGVTMVVNALEEIESETLDLVQGKICGVINEESRALIELLYRNYSLLEEYITIKTSEMKKSTENIIGIITKLEMEAIQKEIADYNEAIAKQFKSKLSAP
ncbi:hypothetical protein VCUG_00816 [Vavraia culicis subsp. floridensis]|uniref:Uncharacterized protein n=1 Tax=Vavraia culicis (isolate floridensis) TaxID=948595 RepID=L2GVR7_VAVCU|nr:uncharacterized protein VCUG_00816 [Vavraia culicis subsp. floridensis]ELA47734.1 hypothetical protein VCUG_00816 [Vavraia culicis subsp. floridensis]